jgi:iron complex outermembrane receptor protein
MGASIVALSAIATSSHAADAAAAADAADSSQGATTLEAIIVTAEKREVNLQDVPIAVTAFTAKQRALVGISTVQDMTDFTPGLTYSSQLDRPVMRGLARNNNIYLSDSAVAVYYDDFFSNSTFLVGRDDMLIDQVEVLLGPQGTLYGRNAIGGLINTLSKRPSDHFGGEIRGVIGNYGYTKIEGTVTGPISDHLSFRVSAYDLNQTRGYFNNIAGGRTEGDVRHDPYVDAQLQYKDDSTTLWFDANTLAFNHDRGGPGALLGTPITGPYEGAMVASGALTYNPNFPFTGGAVPGSVVGMVPGLTNNPAITNIRNFAHNYETDISVHAAYTFLLHATHHFDGFDIKYVGGYSQYHYHLHTAAAFLNDNSSITSYQIPLNPAGQCAILGPIGPTLPPAFGGGPNPLNGCGPATVHPQEAFTYETLTQWYSHEITLSSTTSGPVQWIAGAYYYFEKDDNPETNPGVFQPQIFNPISVLTGAPLANPSGNVFLLDYQDRIRSIAVYGQVDWKLTDTLKLTGGLRYTNDHKTAVEETRFIAYQDLDPCVGLACAAGTGLNAGNLGSFLPAFDITPALISFAPAKGVTCAASLATTGKFAGAWTRCLGDTSAAFSGTVGLSWTPDRDTLAYIRYNRGYKAFGLNAGFTGSNPEAAPEYVNDVEVGIKKTIGRNFQINADAFYYDYINDQVPLTVPVGQVNLTEFVNIPKSVSEGVEFTANWSPFEHLNLSFVYGYNFTQIKSACTLVGGAPVGACYVDTADPFALAAGAKPVFTTASGDVLQSPQGAELPQAPRNKLAFNANYTFVWDPGSLTVSGSFIWKDTSYESIFQRTYNSAPSWNQVDLRATWTGKDDRYAVVLFIKNVFNTLGYDAAAGGGYILQPIGGGPPTQARAYDLTPPRLYGAEFHVKF